MDLQLIKITYKGNEHGVPPPPLFLLKELKKKEINSEEEAFGTIRYPPSNQTDLDFHDFGKLLLFCLSRFDFYNEYAPPFPHNFQKRCYEPAISKYCYALL